MANDGFYITSVVISRDGDHARTVDSGQGLVDSGQWTVDRGWWAEGGERCWRAG